MKAIQTGKLLAHSYIATGNRSCSRNIYGKSNTRLVCHAQPTFVQIAQLGVRAGLDSFLYNPWHFVVSGL